MRNVFIFTILLIALLTGLFYYVFYTPALITKMAPEFIEQKFPEASVLSLSIGSQSFTYPETLKLYDIHSEINWKNELYEIKIAEFDFLNIQSFLRDKQKAVLDFSGLTLNKKNGQLANAAMSMDIVFDAAGVSSCQIVLRDGQLQNSPYKITSLQAKVGIFRDRINIFEIQGRAFGGQAKGKIDLIFAPQPSQNVSIDFNDLQSQEMAALHKTIFAQLNGQFSGTMSINRVEETTQVFVIMAQMSPGSIVKADLAKKIFVQETDEKVRDKIADILLRDQQLSFDQADFRVLNLNQRLAEATFYFENNKEDLRIRETMTINLEQILSKIAWEN